MAGGGTRQTAERGFSLVEMMVGLVLASIVIAALFNMFITSSYVFQQQDQTSMTQLNLRQAIDQVREDLRRAGLHSTPNSQIDRLVCPRPTTELHGIAHLDGVGADDIPFRDSTNREVVPDRLVLTGNYSSAAAYQGSVSGQTVAVQLPEWSGETGWKPTVYTEEGFRRVFRQDQFIRLTNAYGYSQIVSIQSVAAATNRRSIVLNQPPQFANKGFCGITGSGDNVEVNPVNFIEYRIEARDPGRLDDVRTDLVRHFLDDDLSRIEDADLVVGEYIVDFQVWFMLKNGDMDGATIPEDGNPFDDRGNLDNSYRVDGSPGSRPDLIRTAVVKVCARTDREDGNWMHRQREDAEGPLVSFDLDDNPNNGSARVTCLSGEVEIVNQTLRNLGAGGGVPG